MHRHLIDQGSAYTLDVTTRLRYMARLERPLGLSLSSVITPKRRDHCSPYN